MTIRRTAVLAVLVLILRGAALPQALSWVDFSGSPACSYIAEGGSGTLFGINGQSNRVIFSSDGGASWVDRNISGDLIYELAANRRTGTVILGRYENFGRLYEILLSTDAGATWSLVPYDARQRPSDFMVDDHGDVFALLDPYGSTQLIQYTNGAWWSLVGNPRTIGSYVTTWAVDHAGNFFLGTNRSGLYSSTDNGTTWIQHFPGNAGSITAIIADSSNRIYVAAQPADSSNGGVFVSSDTGRTWSSLGLYGINISGLTVDNSGTVYASSLYFIDPRTQSGSLYRNIPNTTLWDNISPSTDGFASILYTRSGNLLAADPSLTVYRSTDKGKTWLNNSISNKDIFSLAVDDSGIIYAGTLGSGVYHTRGSDLNDWKETLLGSTCNYIYSLVYHGEKVFAATDCGIFCTSDRGENWTNLSAASFNYSAYATAVNSRGELFAGTMFGVYRSTDSGSTWTPSGIATHRVLQIAIDGADRLFVLTDRDGVFRSSDNGVSWTGAGVVRSDALTIAVNGSDQLFVGANSAIFRSIDHGGTWQNIPTDTVNFFSFAFRGSGKIFAATSDGVFSSTDNGTTWRPAGYSGMSESLVLSLAFDPHGSLIAGTYRGSVYKSIQTVSAAGRDRQVPLAMQLGQNFPNPFNPTTAIRYRLDARSYVTLVVYNVLGQKVASLVDGVQEPGDRSVEWKAGSLPSGVYFYRLTAGSFTQTKKMLLVR
jgi:photosystem II stability/assembly factor-like uncharacterized protein